MYLSSRLTNVMDTSHNLCYFSSCVELLHTLNLLDNIQRHTPSYTAGSQMVLLYNVSLLALDYMVYIRSFALMEIEFMFPDQNNMLYTLYQSHHYSCMHILVYN